MTTRRLPVVLAFVAVLVATALVVWSAADRGPRAEVVGDSSRDGWHTIEYDGAQVDIPGDWELVDPSECEFQFETWAPPATAGCTGGAGVSFYGSATFDPAHRPGVRRTDDGWSGYRYVGDYAVYVADPDRDLVEEILASARTAD